jgi:hypothetical protein
MHVLAAGYGSIARPMAGRLAEFGVPRFTLVDPKEYHDRSVASQCEPDEVGRPKAEVGAERLAALGVGAEAVVGDLAACPDGVVTDRTVVVASVDNRRGDIIANQLAARMRVPLVKANIEPRYDMVAVRCYDFRRKVRLCAECQFSDRAYQQQIHPNSCDAPAGRRTAAPRWLSQAAGSAAALAVAQLADDETAAAWYGHEWQLNVRTGKAQWTELTPSRTCRWDHRRHWPRLDRLPAGPEEISLAGLLRRAGTGGAAGVTLRFCQRLSTRACCDRCGRVRDHVRWLPEGEQAVGTCPCGGRLYGMPYWTYTQIGAEALESVLDRPMVEWGVAPHAVIGMKWGRHRRSFVVGRPDRAGYSTGDRT